MNISFSCRNFSSLFLPGVLSFLLIVQTGCTKKDSFVPLVSDSTATPRQEISNSTLFCYEGNHLLFRLNSDYSRKTLSDTSSMLVVPVRLTIYDTIKSNKTIVRSDSGLTKKSLEHFFIWGNVDIRKWDGLIIRSQSLWWNKRTHRVGSDAYVLIITTEGDSLRGKGLDADENFTTWSLRNNVSGRFPDFQKRMDTNDSL